MRGKQSVKSHKEKSHLSVGKIFAQETVISVDPPVRCSLPMIGFVVEPIHCNFKGGRLCTEFIAGMCDVFFMPSSYNSEVKFLSIMMNYSQSKMVL